MARHHPDVFGHIGCHSGDAYFEYCYLPDFSGRLGFLKVPGSRRLVRRLRPARAGDEDPRRTITR